MSLILFTIHTQLPKAKTQNPSEATIAATAPTQEATSNTTIAATPFSKTEIATQPHRSAIATQPSEPARQHAARTAAPAREPSSELSTEPGRRSSSDRTQRPTQTSNKPSPRHQFHLK